MVLVVCSHCRYKGINEMGRFSIGEAPGLSLAKGVLRVILRTSDHFPLCLVLSFDSTGHSTVFFEDMGENMSISISFIHFFKVAKYVSCHLLKNFCLLAVPCSIQDLIS